MRSALAVGALRHPDRLLDGREQTARIRLAGAREVQRRAMIDRGANNRQAKRDVDAVTKTRILERGQALIVVHRENTIATCQHGRRKHRIGRQRPEQRHALCAQAFKHRDDDVDLFTPQVAPLAGVRIEAGNQDARTTDAVLFAPSRMQDAQRFFDRAWVTAAGTSLSGRCVVTSATRSPPPASIITTLRVPVRSARYSV
jgi:hypothetical protein